MLKRRKFTVRPGENAPMMGHLPAPSSEWRRELEERGFIHLDQCKDHVLRLSDMDDVRVLWCFCDTAYLKSRFDKCPKCGESAKTIMVE